jgi:hypothetical protein
MTEQAPPQAVAPKPPPFLFTSPSKDKYQNILIYGAYGSGKTTLAGSAQDVGSMKDVLFISAESGDRSLVTWPGMTVVRISTYSQLARIFEWMTVHCRYRDANDIEKLAKHEALITGVVPENPKRFYTVAIDSLTEVQKYLMYQLLGIQLGSRLDLPPDSPEFKEWGQSSEMVQLLVRSFRDLPVNTIFVAAMQEVENEKKQQLKRLNLPGKLATNVQGFLDVVGYLATAKDGDGGTIRRLYITEGPTWQAKHRFPGVKVDYIEDPTMAKLLALDSDANTTPKENPSNGNTSAAAGPTQPRPATPATRPAVGPARQPTRTVPGNGGRPVR